MRGKKTGENFCREDENDLRERLKVLLESLLGGESSENNALKYEVNNLDSDGGKVRRGRDEEEEEENPGIFDEALRKITNDIQDCYSEKLFKVKAKMEYLEISKPDQRLIFLAEYLIGLYREHPNRSELWLDMFQRLTGGAKRSLGLSLKSWLDERTQARQAMRASINDLHRERDRVSAALEKMAQEMIRSRSRRQEMKTEMEEQRKHCRRLLALLEELRLKRGEKERETKAKRREEEDKRRRKKAAEEKAERRRREKDKERLREHKEIQEASRERMQMEVALEVREMARMKRERQMQDFIRANLRRVMAEKKKEENEEKKRQKAVEEMAKEARLESLRKSARMSLGLLDAKNEDEISTATQNTKSFNARIKTLTDERLNSAKSGCSRSFRLFGYNEDDVLADPRLIVEAEMREKGLLRNKYAVKQLLEQIEPPTKPRPDHNSQISFTNMINEWVAGSRLCVPYVNLMYVLLRTVQAKQKSRVFQYCVCRWPNFYSSYCRGIARWLAVRSRVRWRCRWWLESVRRAEARNTPRWCSPLSGSPGVRIGCRIPGRSRRICSRNSEAPLKPRLWPRSKARTRTKSTSSSSLKGSKLTAIYRTESIAF